MKIATKSEKSEVKIYHGFNKTITDNTDKWDKSKLMKEIADDVKRFEEKADDDSKEIPLSLLDYKRRDFVRGKTNDGPVSVLNQLGIIVLLISIAFSEICIGAWIRGAGVSCDDELYRNISSDSPPKMVTDYNRCITKYNLGLFVIYGFLIGISLVFYQEMFRFAKYKFLYFCFPSYHTQRMEEKAQKDTEWTVFVAKCIGEFHRERQAKHEQEKTLRYKKREINSLFKSLLNNNDDSKISALADYINFHFPIKDD